MNDNANSCKDNPKQRSEIQKFSVLIGAIVTAGFYVILRVNVEEITFIDKFWCTLPIFSSLITTDRCIIKRILNVLVKNKIK